jgi:hypothetical protein
MSKVISPFDYLSTHVSGENFIGDLKIPSANARLMVRLSVLSAWAELQIQSTQQDYLVDIVTPHVGALIAMWLEVLTAYARLQFEPDVGDGAVVEDLVLDSQSSFASKEFLRQVTNFPYRRPDLRSTTHAGCKSSMRWPPLLNWKANICFGLSIQTT